MLWRMSASQRGFVSERIKSIPAHGHAQRGLERIAIDYIDCLSKETGDEILDANIVEHRHLVGGVELDEDVDVAIGPVVAARGRTNRAACLTPRARNAASLRRRVAMA
jgi:hypothetical protein